MSELRFNEEDNFHIKSRRLFGEPTTPSMISFLLRFGIVKNEKQALVLLLSFVFVIIFLTIYISNVFLIGGDGLGYIKDRFGNKYTPEQYFKLRQEGKDPLSPDFLK